MIAPLSPDMGVGGPTVSGRSALRGTDLCGVMTCCSTTAGSSLVSACAFLSKSCMTSVSLPFLAADPNRLHILENTSAPPSCSEAGGDAEGAASSNCKLSASMQESRAGESSLLTAPATSSDNSPFFHACANVERNFKRRSLGLPEGAGEVLAEGFLQDGGLSAGSAEVDLVGPTVVEARLGAGLAPR